MKARMKITTKEMKRSTYEMRIGDKMVMFFFGSLDSASVKKIRNALFSTKSS